ncbi:hypothetical protein N7457_009718 [Penicillium paradoxum]|uniref:uncharacterized protein n=1 Tax=Penicillium paradoxum TaxID=176176 RepID=UPI0025485651|nr:uncharacterized protein N7457_009718 [Penicillium paradoxum]KAJ5774822.1 hypothetical protein N7457_009718 [Penicillium paradoxum]
MPAIPSKMETQTTIMVANLLKRSSMSDPDKYPLYVFLIIIGCIAGGLIGFSIYTMYHGTDDSSNFKDTSVEQRRYMRELRQQNFNALAVYARRPDLITPTGEGRA